ncbi:hypothetical protein [Longimicrobium sp.]|uniref:hypothetical protein n=1 Tax=Longimicrobium sp. TaxID=2029185 RepID=UPI002BF253B8|nr:hypothetical protein [Longimicrobium sp.]HSU17254.1 hypothetical protein [Longimicrobium sp.]
MEIETDPPEPPAWFPAEDGSTLGQPGTEGGIILRDDEHPWGARITLERGSEVVPFAITCGIYGWMMHTCWLPTLGQAEREFAQMRDAISAILEMIPLSSDPLADEKMRAAAGAMGRFTLRFP